MGDNTTIGLLTNINNSLGKIVELMLPQNQDSKKVQEQSVKNLSQGGLGTGANNAAKNTVSSAENISGLNIAQIVSSLDSLPEQVKLIAKLSGRTIRNFERVINSIISIFSNEAFRALDNKGSETGASLMKSLTELGKLPDAIKDVGKIKEKDVKTFAKTIGILLEMITKNLRSANVSEDDIKLAQQTTNTILALTSAVKAMAKMTLIAPLAMVGLLSMIPVWLTFSAVLMLFGLMETPIQKGLSALRGVDEFMTKMLKTALLGIAVAGGVILLGLVLKENMDLMLYGLAGMTAVFVAVGIIAVLGGLVGLLIKSTNIFDKQIIKFTLELMLIAGLTVMLGMLLQVGWKQALFGLGGMLTVMIAMSGIAFMIGVVGFISIAIVKALGGVMVLMLGAMAIAGLSILLGKYLSDYWDYALYGFVAMNIIMVEVLGIARFAKTVGDSAKSGIIGLLLAEGVMLGAMVLVWATIKTGELIWDYFGKETETALAKVGVVGAVITAIVYAAVGVTKIAKRAEKDIIKGAVALLAAEGVILAGAVVTAAVIGVSTLLNKANLDSASITITLGIMSSIVVAAGAVAALASGLHTTIKKGALTMVAIELLILGMTGVMYAIVKTAEAASKVGWESVQDTVKWMGILVTGMGILVAGIGALCLNPLVTAALAAGAITLGTITLLIFAVTRATTAVIQLDEKMKESGTTTDDMKTLLTKITHDVFSYETLNPNISKSEVLNLSAKYLAIRPALWGIGKLVDLVSDMAKKFGGLTDGTAGGSIIRPFYGMRGNEPVFGEPVDIKAVATNIVESIKEFTGIVSAFDGIDQNKLKDIGKTMGKVVEPVSAFIQALSKFKGGANGNILTPVFFTKDGRPIEGEPVDIGNVASIIASAVSNFALNLYGNGESLPKWAESMGKKRNAKRLENAMNTLSIVVEPVNNFISMMLGFSSVSEGKLKKIMFDEQGNYIDNGAPEVDIVLISGNIANSIKKFAEILFGDKAAWMDVFRKDKDKERVNAAMHTLGSVISPIQSFMEAITAIEASGDDMYYVWVDEYGNVQRRKVNLTESAKAIADTVSSFVKTLFGDETTSTWTNMINAVNGGKQLIIGGNENNSPFSVFGTIIDPIANFTRVLFDLGASAQNDSLVIPVYDSNGKKVNERVLDVINTARIIAKAVTEFVSELFSDENKAKWISLLYTFDDKGNRLETGLGDSIGVFALIIDPIAKFMDMVSKFGGTADDFKIYDPKSKKPRSINLMEVADAIGKAVETFVNKIKPVFSEIGFSATESDKVNQFGIALSSILSSFAKIGDIKAEQVNTANTVLENYEKTVQKISDTVAILPDKRRMDDMKSILTKCIDIFNMFQGIKFETLQYKEGLAHIVFVFTQCEEISRIAKNVDTVIFDKVDRFIAAADLLQNFFKTQVYYDKETVSQYVESIREISVMYANIPTMPDTQDNRNKLWFVEPFADAVRLVKGVIDIDSNFAVNSTQMIDFITKIGNSMLALGSTPATDLDDVSKAYTTLLERVIKLSDKRNVKSISSMNDAIKEATTRMTKFDDRLIKHANDRKRKLDELVETVGNLNEKLEKTAQSMESIAKDLEKISGIDENTITRKLNVSNTSDKFSSPIFGDKGSAEPTHKGEPAAAIPTSSTSKYDIQEAIESALKNLKLLNSEYTISIAKELFPNSSLVLNPEIKVSGHEYSIDSK